MVFDKVFSPKSIIINLESEDKDELFEELGQAIFSVHPEINREEALEALHTRETQMSTGVIKGIAVPHGTCKSVKGCVGAVGISHKGIDYDSLDGNPVNLVFMILCGESENEFYVKVLSDLATTLQNPLFASELVKKTSAQDVFDFLCHADD